MFNLDKFIADSVTFRPTSMFEPDIQANAETLTREIRGKKVCVIGGAGSIGSSFIKAVLRFEPKSVVVVDLPSTMLRVNRLTINPRQPYRLGPEGVGVSIWVRSDEVNLPSKKALAVSVSASYCLFIKNFKVLRKHCSSG